jgi:hypothetical protein
MKSPFPVMDPYLERYWGDVHAKLLVYACDQIQEQLPTELQARVEETVRVAADGDKQWLVPDVLVVEEPAAVDYAVPAATTAAVPPAAAKPWRISIPPLPRRQRHVVIVDPTDGDRVVTAVEVLSPRNKTIRSERRRYRKKQRIFLLNDVNLVEIDLLRTGRFILAVPDRAIPDPSGVTYWVCVRRAIEQECAELYPIGLREPLRNIRIPLRPNDADILLQLQPLIDRCYRSGRYDRIDYRQPLRPPLTEDDRCWLDSLLAERTPAPSDPPPA